MLLAQVVKLLKITTEHTAEDCHILLDLLGEMLIQKQAIGLFGL
jgi:hypothetical protein